jgi:ribosomal protein S18 acetylase RimI-like enzyme
MSPWIPITEVAVSAQRSCRGETWLRERTVQKVMLLVRETNTKVEAFYKGIGYENIPRIIMQKWLVEP